VKIKLSPKTIEQRGKQVTKEEIAETVKILAKEEKPKVVKRRAEAVV
jgi:hypothetical protein